MSIINSQPLIGASGSAGYQISRSVRLRASATAYFNRTFGTPTDNKKWTLSAWIKKGGLGTAIANGDQPLLAAPNGVNADIFFIEDNGTDQFSFFINSVIQARWTPVYRDPSAWYHVVLNYDSANATQANRLLLYINGTQITTLSTPVGISLNQSTTINANAVINRIGNNAINTRCFDGYLTEVNFIDGQALSPSNFGETNTITGVWQPKKYNGTYGTNGFYLNFSDNSGVTATTIGKDYSGNGNNWTPNNISVTAGATYDSMLDVPTLWADGGNGRGNYATLNPLSTLYTVTNGNLDFTYTNSTSGVWYLKDTLAVSYGKYYWEVTPTNVGAGLNISIGIILDTNTQTNTTTINLVTDGYVYHSDGNKYSGSTVAAYGATYTNNDVIGVALDLTAGTLVFYKNNVSQGTAFTGLTSSYMLLVCCHLGGTSRTVAGFVNAGQRPFAYTPPSGFKALNTQNLPTPTILKGNQYFDATLWTGNQAARTITNSGEFQPDLIWTKSRSDAESHRLHDSVRGGNGSVLYELNSNETSAEGTDTLVSGFASNGFTIASGVNTPNITSRTYVGWQWKEGATQGFDIVTYTGNGTSQNVNHSLGVAPAMIIVKDRVNAVNWAVWHKSLPSGTNVIEGLNTTSAATNQTVWTSGGGTYTPTSTQFSVNGTSNMTNSVGGHVAYLFAEVAGFSKFGSYTGNGSSDGPFVFCGFRPRWIMVKRTDSTGEWYLRDTSRDLYNVSTQALYANQSSAETTSSYLFDLNSNGFKLRSSGIETNANGGTYIYAAFAENPFKYSLAR